MDSCVYTSNSTAVRLSHGRTYAKNAAQLRDLKNSRALMHAAMMEWRTVEAYQQTLLDLTRE